MSLRTVARAALAVAIAIIGDLAIIEGILRIAGDLP